VITDAAAGAREGLGLDIAVLRSVFVPSDDDAYFFAENLTDRPPLVGAWCDEEAMRTRAVADGRDRAAVLRWFEERRAGAPARLAPWQREGWFEEAVSWIRATLPGVTAVEQYITWSSSCLLRIAAAGRRAYFKAAPEYFGQEAAMTARLAERFPDLIPRPVAVDVDRGWLVLEDFGDALVESMGLPHWEAALDTLLEIHRGGVSAVESLLAAGLVDRRPPVLAAQIEGLARLGPGELPEGVGERLREAVPRLTERCAELAASPIPNTLVHGDFHAGNVVVHHGRYLIFDWTDPCIAHPFVDLETLLRVSGPPSTDPRAFARLRDRYLDGWSDVVSLREGVELFERMEPLAAMHHALSYRAIIQALEPGQRWEWTSHLPWWLGRALV
jgi:hypothetical protein